MDKAEYRAKKEALEDQRRAVETQSYLQSIIDALVRIADQAKDTDRQSNRADRFHRLAEKLSLRLERKKFRLEIAETLGLWFAAAVGVAAIVVANHDSEVQTKVMQAQLTAMQGQLSEMKGTGAQTDQMIETNKHLAEAAAKQADAAVKQAEAAVETVKTAQNNMIASQRAWVGPRNARSDTGPELGKELTVFIDYQNSGREPGVEAVYDANLFIASEDEDAAGKPHEWVTDFVKKCKTTWAPTKSQVIYPSTGGFGGGGYALSKKFEGHQIDEEVIAGTKSLIVTGCFVYKTIAVIRRSSFCYYYNAKQSKPAAWNICEFGNDAD